MRNALLKFALLTLMLLGLPLVGASLVGHSLEQYFEFPTTKISVPHAGFSWGVFVLIAGLALGVLIPLGLQVLRRWNQEGLRKAQRYPFPWWGHAGVALGAVSWVLAWTRLPGFAPLQAHTFTPQWLAYIVVINALTYQRTGRCMLLDRPRFFLLLFPVSAVFWWFFEFLNRFVQNWYYVGHAYTAWEYVWAITPQFATVLPAVLGTQEWLRSFQRLEGSFARFHPIRFHRPRLVAAVVLAVSGLGLMGIGIWPDSLFPLIWVSPGLILVALRTLGGERHVLSDISVGDWRPAVTAALASLICGFFWELWNFHSLFKWIYAVPYLQRFLVFEMPLLGFAGYLPFGLECASIGLTLASVEVASAPGREFLEVAVGQ
jgi:hypothetical protein